MMYMNSVLVIAYLLNNRFGSTDSLCTHSSPERCIHRGALFCMPITIGKAPPTATITEWIFPFI